MNRATLLATAAALVIAGVVTAFYPLGTHAVPRSTRSAASRSGVTGWGSRTWSSRAPSRTTSSSARAGRPHRGRRPGGLPARLPAGRGRGGRPGGEEAVRRDGLVTVLLAYAGDERAPPGQTAGQRSARLARPGPVRHDRRRGRRRLAAAEPGDAADYTARADALHAELTALDRSTRPACAHCARHEIVTSHAAFGYLAERYHLTQIGDHRHQRPTPSRRRGRSPRWPTRRGPPAPPRSSSRRWSAPRSPRRWPQDRREGRRARPDRGPGPGSPGTTSRSCGPTSPRCAQALGCA
jgi:hypothetical protein